MLSHIWSNPWLLKYKSDHKKRVDTKTRRTTSWVLKNTQQQLRGQTEESRPYQQCRLNMLLLLVWFELWTQYPGPLCLWQCLVLLRTYEPIFSQFGATLSNMCIRSAMASIKQTINQESHFDLRIVDIASDGSKQGVLSKIWFELTLFPRWSDQRVSAPTLLDWRSPGKDERLGKNKKREIKGINHSLKSTQSNRPDIQIWYKPSKDSHSWAQEEGRRVGLVRHGKHFDQAPAHGSVVARVMIIMVVKIVERGGWWKGWE